MRGRRASVKLVALVALVAVVASACVLDGEWTAVTPFDPVPATQTHVNDVACLSATDCLVVGFEAAPSGGQPVPQLQRWDGASWTALPAPPTPAGATYALPTKISCGSPTACGVALLARVGTGYVGRFARWDGATWSAAPLGGPMLPQRDDVWCGADGSCVFTSAGGQTVTWDGSAYASVALNTPPLEELSCTSLVHCVGVEGNPETYHFDGSAWTTVEGPSLPGRATRYVGVHCFTATDCLAVGSDYPGGLEPGDVFPAAGRWNGTSWAVTPLPGGIGTLHDVSCASSVACVAVGFDDAHAASPVAFGWNGGQWYSMAAPPAPVPFGNHYLSISCSTGDHCLAVGFADATLPADRQPLIASYQWTST